MKAIIPIFDTESKRAVYLQLYDYIKNCILAGEISEGEKLPSLRSLAKSLSLSLTTVTSAYEQLEVEGYIYSKPQSGYYIRNVQMNVSNTGKANAALGDSTARTAAPQTAPQGTNAGVSSFQAPSFAPYDKAFAAASPYKYDLSCFDFTKWKKCMSQVLTEHADLLMFESDPQGEAALRYELCKYLFSARGVKCTPEQIVIGAGTQQIMGSLSLILRSDGINHIVVEDPGYTPARHIFRDRGFAVSPVPVDENGILIEKMPANIRTAAYINPNNQFPTGAVIPIGNRYKLLDWALKNDSFIIEDDYDSEFRYTGKPIPSMQGLDTENRVIYLGAFSSTLFSSVKISYMVLPQQLAQIFFTIKNNYTQTCSKAEQLTLAIFMERGLYQINIKKLRTLYAQKLQKLLAAIDKYGNDIIVPLNTASGINITFRLCTRKNAEAVTAAAAEFGVPVKPIETKDTAAGQSDSTYILYYNQIPLDEIEPCIKSIIETWRH